MNNHTGKRNIGTYVCRIMALLLGILVNFDFFTIGGMSIVSLLILVYFVFVIISFRIGKISKLDKKFFLLPFLYLTLLILLNLLNSNYINNTVFPIGFIFCIILYYVTFVHVKNDPRTIDFFLSGFVLGGIGMSICFMLGIGVEFEGGRLEIFGSNSNNLGCLMCISLSIVLYRFVIKDCFKLKWLRLCFIIVLVPIIEVVLFSASRTALIITVTIILLCLFISIKKIKSKRARFMYLSVIVCGGYFIINNLVDFEEYETMYSRVVEMRENENANYSSGRTTIWDELLVEAIQHPLGLGQTGYTVIAQKLMSSTKIDGEASPHNVPLEVFLYTGILGFIIMLSFWIRIFIKALHYFRDKNDLTFILLITIFYIQMMFGQILLFRVAWITFGIIAGALLLQSKRIKYPILNDNQMHLHDAQDQQASI